VPYEPINQIRSASVLVEDARLGEKTGYKDDLAREMQLEREALRARGPQPSLLDKIKAFFRRG